MEKFIFNDNEVSLDSKKFNDSLFLDQKKYKSPFLIKLDHEEIKQVEKSWLEKFQKDDYTSFIQRLIIEQKDKFVKMVANKFIPGFDSEKIEESYIKETSNLFDFLLVYDEEVIGRVIGNFDMEGRGQNLNFNFTGTPGL